MVRRLQVHLAPYVENSHEPIIPRHLFLLVQDEIVKRAATKTGTGRRSVYSGKNALSSIVYCAHCGDFYQRTQWLLKGKHIPVWRCVSRLQKKKRGVDCPSRTIFETNLHAAVVAAVNQLIGQKDDLLPRFRASIENALGNTNSHAIEDVNARLEALQKELLNRADARQGYGDLPEKIEVLRDERQKLLLEDATAAGIWQQLDAIDEFIAQQQTMVTEYDDALVRRLIEKITVHDDHLTFGFKSGLEIDVKA